MSFHNWAEPNDVDVLYFFTAESGETESISMAACPDKPTLVSVCGRDRHRNFFQFTLNPTEADAFIEGLLELRRRRIRMSSAP